MKKYKSEIYEVVHQDAMADFEVGGISEARMREYDKLCLVEESEPVYKAGNSANVEQISPVTA